MIGRHISKAVPVALAALSIIFAGASAARAELPRKLFTPENLSDKCFSQDENRSYFCLLAGDASMRGSSGRGGEYSVALRHYREACRLHNDSGCMHMLQMYLDKLADSHSAGKDFALMDLECHRGSGALCLEMAAFFDPAVRINDDYADPQQAESYYRAACEWSVQAGCVKYADFMQSRLKTERTKEEVDRMLELYAAACGTYEGEGCLKLGQIYERGKLVNQDPVKYRMYYARACELDNDEGCDAMIRTRERRRK